MVIVSLIKNVGKPTFNFTDFLHFILPFTKCTKSKNFQKVVTRHIWEEYKEQMNENRYTQVWKDNYPLRKETVERTFGDCKEQHGLRYTRIRGLLKNEHNSTMIFACHNLKKMANWRWNKKKNSTQKSTILVTLLEKFYFYSKKAVYLFKYTTLSTN